MITFTTINTAMPQIDTQQVTRWIEAVAASHNRTVGDICYAFADDEAVLSMNRQFLQHDYYTDIITFDYCEGRRIAGDIIISTDTVASNAQALGKPLAEETLRVIIHGVLHLCGIDDKGPGEREIMERAENNALALLHTL